MALPTRIPTCPTQFVFPAEVRHDRTRPDATRHDTTHKTRLDTTQQAKPRLDTTRRDPTRHDTDTARHDMARHGTARTRHDTVRHDKTRQDTTQDTAIPRAVGVGAPMTECACECRASGEACGSGVCLRVSNEQGGLRKRRHAVDISWRVGSKAEATSSNSSLQIQAGGDYPSYWE